MAFELLSLLCTFENSTDCSILSFDSNHVPRVFLRHTLITKPNEHPGTPGSTMPKNGQICSYYGFRGL